MGLPSILESIHRKALKTPDNNAMVIHAFISVLMLMGIPLPMFDFFH